MLPAMWGVLRRSTLPVLNGTAVAVLPVDLRGSFWVWRRLGVSKGNTDTSCRHHRFPWLEDSAFSTAGLIFVSLLDLRLGGMFC